MVPILMYHALDGRPSPITLSPDLFAWQMHWLHRQGFQTVTMRSLVAHWQSGRPVAPKSICLTFDDGFAGVYTHAFPLLQQLGFTATIFLVAGYCGRDNGWPGQPAIIPRLPLLDWRQIREMAAYGVEFGGHTITHPRLDLLPAAAMYQEVVDGKAMLEQELGQSVETFAYPYGRFSPPTQSLVQQTYRAACTTWPGRATPAHAASALPRADVFYLQPTFLFRYIQNPLLFAYLMLRRVVSTAVSTLRQRPW